MFRHTLLNCWLHIWSPPSNLTDVFSTRFDPPPLEIFSGPAAVQKSSSGNLSGPNFEFLALVALLLLASGVPRVALSGDSELRLRLRSSRSDSGGGLGVITTTTRTSTTTTRSPSCRLPVPPGDPAVDGHRRAASGPRLGRS
eukprot:2092758-Rhodomonas_salina.2